MQFNDNKKSGRTIPVQPLESIIDAQLYSAFVYQISYADIWHAAVRRETDLAGTAVRITDMDACLFDLRSELAESILVQLRMSEATVTGEGAAAYSLRNEHLG